MVTVWTISRVKNIMDNAKMAAIRDIPICFVMSVSNKQYMYLLIIYANVILCFIKKKTQYFFCWLTDVLHNSNDDKDISTSTIFLLISITINVVLFTGCFVFIWWVFLQVNSLFKVFLFYRLFMHLGMQCTFTLYS